MKAPWSIAGQPRDTSVLLAFSGGADSRFLLHTMAQFAKRDEFSITLAHVNHGIRGAEAVRDRDFCVEIAKQYGVEIAVLDADVPSLAKQNGRGLEEEAREVRYAYFAKLMKERKIPLLVTAHNADDNAETVLFRMARGSGLCGLGGIAPMRPFENGFLVRPMLHITKREVLEYCEQEGLQYVTDSTNADTYYARNKLRAEVLPTLETLFDGATERISVMAERLREDEAVLSALSDRFLQTYCKDGKCQIEQLLQEPKAIQRRILSDWFYGHCKETLQGVHIDALQKLCVDGAPHSALSLPCETTVAIESGMLCVQNRDRIQSIDYELPFCEGETKIPFSDLSVLVKKKEKNLKVHNLSTAPYIILTENFDIMKKELYWRPRREGDKLLMRGMHRSVRKLYREAGLSLELRARLPLLCDKEGIVWIPYIGMRDGVGCASPDQMGTYVALMDANLSADRA